MKVIRVQFGNENSSAKKSERSKENNLPQAKKLWDFVKCLSEFAKGIYETCDRNFFNLAIIIVTLFSIVQFISFLHFDSNN